MSSPGSAQSHRVVRRAALVALVGGAVVMGLKLAVYGVTGSAAVLTDAVESAINIIAAAVMTYSVHVAAKPPDEDHPYGHGKIEFMTLGFEGGMILAAAAAMLFIAIERLVHPRLPHSLDTGTAMLAGVNLINAALAYYIYRVGKSHRSAALVADAKHLLTDVLSTFGVVAGMLAMLVVDWPRLDGVVALALAAVILVASLGLLRQSIQGLMDYNDKDDQAAIRIILDDEVASGRIRGYHKVRHRHVGNFMWIDMHMQVSADMTVADSHALASAIEYRLEQRFTPAKATAHIEPASAT